MYSFAWGMGRLCRQERGGLLHGRKQGRNYTQFLVFVFTAFRLLRQLSCQKEEKGKALPLVLGFGFQEWKQLNQRRKRHLWVWDGTLTPDLGGISMRRSWGASRRLGKHTQMHHNTGKVKVKVAQLCPTLCNPMDYTVHGILQARILDWVAFLFFRGSSQCRNWTQVSCIVGGFFISWAT